MIPGLYCHDGTVSCAESCPVHTILYRDSVCMCMNGMSRDTYSAYHLCYGIYRKYLIRETIKTLKIGSPLPNAHLWTETMYQNHWAPSRACGIQIFYIVWKSALSWEFITRSYTWFTVNDIVKMPCMNGWLVVAQDYYVNLFNGHTDQATFLQWNCV